MNQPNRDYTDLLLSKGIISLEQLTEAVKLGKSEDKSVGEALVALGYATPEEVTRALAKFNKVEYVDLTETRIADDIHRIVEGMLDFENLLQAPVGGIRQGPEFQTRFDAEVGG